MKYFLVVLVHNNIIHVEVKNGWVDKFPHQHTQFYDFLQKNYGNLGYIPMLYQSENSKLIKQSDKGCENCRAVGRQNLNVWCDKTFADIQNNQTTNQNFERLATDLLLRSVMVLGKF